ncbi:hypothetical protein GCM10008983_18620 [Lentibacillus halophilus]|uniref:Regulatory protein YrvL n=1 Tax=Lentibacillus halophilus TaxID=295065 RepID=A0ABP3J4M0_9BACI
MKENIKNIIGMTLFVIFIMGIFIAIYFFGIAGIFELIGVQYQSIWSLIIFVISIFILGLPVDLVLGSMAELTVEKIRGKITAFVIQFLFGFVTNWVVIFIVDVFMSGINLSPGAKLVSSLILTIFESVFGNEKNKHRKEAV